MKHGTNKAYTRGACRCDNCRTAHAAYKKRVKKLQAYGRYQQQRRNPAKTLEHINKLRAANINLKQISTLTGVKEETLGRIARGAAQTIQADTERRVLALQPAPEHINPGTLIDSTGTTRRLQALQHNGWTQPQIAEQLGSRTANIWLLVNGRQATSKRVADQVSDLYDLLWDKQPTPWTMYNTLAANTARRNGWLPALAWDEDRINDPNHTGYPEAVAA